MMPSGIQPECFSGRGPGYRPERLQLLVNRQQLHRVTRIEPPNREQEQVRGASRGRRSELLRLSSGPLGGDQRRRYLPFG